MSMDVRRFFRLGFQYEQRINFLTERIRQLRSNLTRTTQSYSDAPRSGAAVESSVECIIVRLEELVEKCAEMEGQLALWTQCAEKVIRALPEQRELFSCRYLERLSWDRVSEKLFFSRAQAFRIHDRILPEAQKALDGLADREDFAGKFVDS